MRYKLLMVIFLFGFVGCASVRMGDPAKDSMLKTFTSKPALAGLYIYRNESMAGSILMDVKVDGKLLGQTAANTYLYTEVSPGTHTIISSAENSDSLEIKAVAGRLYYIWQEVKFGFLSARTKLHLVEKEEGQKGVLDTKLAANNG